MKKYFAFLCLFALCGFALAKQVGDGAVQVNNNKLTAKLFDDPALNPTCRQKFGNAMQAMFYLDGNSFAHGCWIPLDGEIHTQMTRYDTNETRAYVFSPSVFKMNGVDKPTTGLWLFGAKPGDCSKIGTGSLDDEFKKLSKRWAGHLEVLSPPHTTPEGFQFFLAIGHDRAGGKQPFLVTDSYEYCKNSKDSASLMQPSMGAASGTGAPQRPSWCKNAKLPHEMEICADSALSRNELDISGLYSEYAKKSGLSAGQLRVQKGEFFNKAKACGADRACIADQQQSRILFYKNALNSTAREPEASSKVAPALPEKRDSREELSLSSSSQSPNGQRAIGSGSSNQQEPKNPKTTMPCEYIHFKGLAATNFPYQIEDALNSRDLEDTIARDPIRCMPNNTCKGIGYFQWQKARISAQDGTYLSVVSPVDLQNGRRDIFLVVRRADAVCDK